MYGGTARDWGQRTFQENHAYHKIVENTYFSNDKQFNFIAMVEPKDSSRITKGKIDEAITALKDIMPKERDNVSDREAVRKMRRYIEKLTSDKYGYTYDEVSEMLKGLGINLSGSRIKYLLGEVKKNTRRKKKPLENENPGGSERMNSVTQPTQLSTASKSINSVTDSKPATSAKSKRKNQQPVQQQPQA